MKRNHAVSPALTGVAVVVGLAGLAAATGAAPDQPARHSFDVVGARVYIDTAGPGRNALLARVKARYRFAPALANERWYGVTTITIMGRGGSKTVVDRDWLAHPASGQMIDHRVPVGAREAARILGGSGGQATVRVRARGHIEMRGAAENGAVSGSGGNGGSGGMVSTMSVVPTEAWPPPQQSFGGQALWVYWSWNEPYRPYIGAVYTWIDPYGEGELQPDRDKDDNPTSGMVRKDNTFTMTEPPWDQRCSTGATVTGTVPPHSGGRFRNQPAVVSAQWCSNGGIDGFGPTSMPRDPLQQG